MSSVTCQGCSASWDAALVPCCPRCLVAAWMATERFVRPKHDPAELPGRSERYRSVLTQDFVARQHSYLEYAATHGTWYYDTFYEMYVHLTPSPLGRSPGVGIPPGKVMPEHALDSLLIVEADSASEAHAFAVDATQHAAQVQAGEFEELNGCAAPGCDNLSVPGGAHCVTHTTHEAPGGP
ncbi:MAG: hypothetical protein JRG96_15080 [Deltaproteobacteria bacterium]|nr:hypothetical protein [Deltaproteobacteria bacterium]MBW2421105.1 hypothetical protein [Deltaproteobacteria bacterium]